MKFLYMLALEYVCHPVRFIGIAIITTIFSLLGIYISATEPDSSIVIYVNTVLMVAISLVSMNVIIYRKKIINLGLMNFLVENQNDVANEAILSFFINEASKSGFKEEYQEFLNQLQGPPRIKDCMIELMKLHSKNEIEA